MVAFVGFFANAQDSNIVTGFRTSDKENTSRFVLDLLQEPVYKISELEKTHRIIIDIKNAEWGKFSDVPGGHLRINGVRHTQGEGRNLQVILDLNAPFAIKKHFVLPPKDKIYRLVVDVEQQGGKAELDEYLLSLNGSKSIPIPHLKEVKKPIIAIDAGHGGHDPGATGYHGTLEKNVTLAYAVALKKELEEGNKYKVILTRGDDNYIDLKKRVEIAQGANADMFISIHADAHNNRMMKGLSVYTLSEKASDKEAEALAQKENKAGLLDNVDVQSDTQEVAELLIDLVQRETKNLSADFAEDIISQVRHETEVLYINPHRFAGFRVLTAPDIPSVLVELGYLSNKKEETMLLSPKHKKKLAETIVRSIDNHFRKYPVE